MLEYAFYTMESSVDQSHVVRQRRPNSSETDTLIPQETLAGRLSQSFRDSLISEVTTHTNTTEAEARQVHPQMTRSSPMKSQIATSTTDKGITSFALEPRDVRFGLRVRNGVIAIQNRMVSWTHPVILCLFCCLYLATAIILPVLLHLSKARHGFDVRWSANVLVWRYIPTAVFTIVIALWRQVDNHTRVSAAWFELAKGWTPARKTLLLDYLSPILPFMFISSIKNKHWRVSLTAATFSILKLAVIFSTGLLVVQNTPITASGLIALQSINETLSADISNQSLTNEVYGNLAGLLPYRAGTSNVAAFQVVSAENDFPASSKITADVVAMIPNLACEDARVTVNFSTYTDYDPDDPGMPAVFPSTSFTINYESSIWSGSTSHINVQRCNGTTWQQCDSPHIYLAAAAQPVNSLSPNISLPALTFAIVQLESPSASKQKSADLAFVSWSSAFVCNVSYVIETIKLIVDSTGGETLSLPDTFTAQVLPGYGASDLLSDVIGLFSYYTSIPSTANVSLAVNDYTSKTWFQLMLRAASQTNITVFEDKSSMKNAAASVFRNVAVQWAKSKVPFSNQLQSNATWTYSKDRLHVQDSNVWEVFALLAIAAIISIILAFSIGLRTTPRRIPISLSAIATCGLQSPEVERLLHGTGHMSDTEIKTFIQTMQFSLAPVSADRVNIQVKESEMEIVGDQEKTPALRKSMERYWKPLSGRTWFVGLCILVCLAEIIVLEVLQRLSDSHYGFCHLGEGSKAVRETVTVIPALAMVSTAALYSAVEWSVGMLSPYQALSKRYPLLKQIDRNTSDGLAPVAFVQAVKRLHLAAAIMITSAVVGSFLTIVVSGLYTISTVPRSYDYEAQTLTQFDTSWYQYYDQNDASIFSLVQYHNASEPFGVYREIAFPYVTLSSTGQEAHNVLQPMNFSNMVINMTMPVIRGSLECVVAPPDTMNYTITSRGYDFPMWDVELDVTMNLPQQCQNTTGRYQGTTQMEVRWFDTLTSPLDQNNGYYVASNLDITGYNASDNSIITITDCPTVAFLMGEFANNTSTEDKTVLFCTQVQEQIPATVRFNMPNGELSLDMRQPPVLDETHRKVITTYQYPFNTLFEESESSFSDVIFNHTGIPIQNLIGQRNEQRFLNVTQHLYRSFMAHYFGGAMRVSASTVNISNTVAGVLPINSTIHATLYDQGSMRLIQNKIPKIVLQVLLACMMLCLIVARSMIDVCVILPHNPCSIAGTMSLLLDSRFAEEVNNVFEETDNIDEPGRRLADRRLRLGWSTRGGDAEPRYGVDFVIYESDRASR